jgi:hypothetical protein
MIGCAIKFRVLAMAILASSNSFSVALFPHNHSIAASVCFFNDHVFHIGKTSSRSSGFSI